MRQVPLVKNRWEGVVPVPATANTATYRFKFDYLLQQLRHRAQAEQRVLEDLHLEGG